MMEKILKGKGMLVQRSQRNTRSIIAHGDLISTMPDDIIANVLSRLTIKEASRTSVLSTKWRYQWTYFSGVIDFDHSLKTYQYARKRKVGPKKRCMVFLSDWEKFMSQLEHVQKSLKSPSMQGLRICMDLGNPLKIAEWIEYAAKKDVQMLELDFSNHYYIEPLLEIGYYIRNVLPMSSSPPTNFQMKSLLVLRLVSVDVCDMVIQHVLVSCPCLETLCVIESRKLTRLDVSGQALRLKHLELLDCHSIISLHIFAENLMTFNFRHREEKVEIIFASVPNLVEASFRGWFASYLQSNMDHLDYYETLLQLHVLKLDIYPIDWRILDLPVFSNLKQLELLIRHSSGAKLDRAINLLDAFPSVSVLKIKFRRNYIGPNEEEWEANVKDEYPNLRELQVSGYKRDPSQIELLVSIVEKAPNLSKIVVDPLSSFYENRSPDVQTRIRERRRDVAVWYVGGLKPYVPPSVELAML